MSKHTPGPWRISYDHEGLPIVVAVAGGAVPIRTPFREDAFSADPRTRADFDTATVDANARLIAAAPDLLAALEDAEFLLRKIAINPKEAGAMVDSFRRSAEDARAAIAKATGEDK